MLKVENINVYYGNIHAIKDISFEVNDGEIVALIGANGAGKSTSLKTVSGLLSSRTGSISFLGSPIDRVPAHKRVAMGLSQVPEGRRIFLQMTVLENLQMGAFTSKADTKADLEKVFEQFPRLQERKTQIAGTLSGGEQQMLAMGRALMSRPKLLAGTTILLVEQNAEMALKIADRAYVLESGRITVSGTGKELAASDRIKKAYLGG